jgi:hypothetical protein
MGRSLNIDVGQEQWQPSDKLLDNITKISQTE